MPKVAWSNQTPAAPTGGRNVKFQSDGGADLEKRSAHIGPATASAPGVIKLEAGLDGTKYLAGDGQWKTPPGGSGGSGVVFSPADIPPVTADAMNDEFDGASIHSRWTNESLGSNISIGTLFPGWVFVRGKDNATDIVKLTQPFVPDTSDFSFTIKVSGNPHVNYQQIGLYVTDDDGSEQAFIKFEFSSALRLAFGKRVGGTYTYGIGAAGVSAPYRGLWYLHLQRVGGTFDAFYSHDGISWYSLVTNHSIPSLAGNASAKIVIELNPDDNANASYCRLGIDWFRHNWVFAER